MMEKPIPKIATRCLAMLETNFQRAQGEILAEMADLVGVDLSQGWKLNENATAFVKDDPPEKTDDS